MDRKRDMAVYGVTLIASFAVGILVGKSACTPPPEKVVEQKIVERTQPCNCQDACACEPDVDTGLPDTVAAAPAPEPEQKEPKAMPEAPPPPDPMTRKRLLAWVRDHSADLEVCRRGTATEVHLTVTRDLDPERGVRRVDLNAPDDELGRSTLSCLRRRMSQWSLPDNFVVGRERVVFGLDL